MPQRWGVPFVAWPQRLRPSYGDGIALPLGIGTLPLARSIPEKGDFPRRAPGITVLCLFVLLFNRLLGRRLDVLAEERLRRD
jgi:ABC-type anion transport system duplicated permease subunit